MGKTDTSEKCLKLACFLLFLLYLQEKMGVNWTYCGYHFTMYVNQTIMLYALNLYSDVCQSFFNTTGKSQNELPNTGTYIYRIIVFRMLSNNICLLLGRKTYSVIRET